MVPKRLAVIFNDLFEKRREGDYMDFVFFSEEDVKPLLHHAEAFVTHIKNLLEKDAL